MTAPTNTSLVCLVSLSSSNLASRPYPKCCGNTELFSSAKKKCVLMDSHLQNKTLSSYLIQSHLDVGFPCLNSFTKCSVASLSCDDSVYRPLTRNTTNLWNGEQYCWDVEKETLNSILIIEKCYKSVDWCILISYWVSLILVLITFFLHVAEPELRKKVKDKCFICYLANLMFLLTVFGDRFGFPVISFLVNLIGEGGMGIAFLYLLITPFSWLNVMCIHMWRTVKSTSSIPERNFKVYAWYAQGLPFIISILILLDVAISGVKNFKYRAKNGGIFSNPKFLYITDIVAVQQIINIFMFLHVGYIIWKHKQQWSGLENSSRHQRISEEKNMFSKLLRLFIIMGLDWITFTLALFYNTKSQFINFFARFTIFPGYLIFITYVVCDERVISVWKNKFGC